MKKKVLAAAVAGAFAAPVIAHAQSTVQLYGAVYMEYSKTSHGGTGARANTDNLQSPGTAIGFRGEEKLGGGLSAWFQCESTAEIRGVGQEGFCSRNSGVGLKGGFGNVWAGNWDTPYKRARVGNIGANDTGMFGNGHLLYGGSTSTTDGASAGVFSRRQRNSINYDLPAMGGFRGMVSFSSTNASTALTAAATNAKGRNWSIGGIYTAGAMRLGIGHTVNGKAYNTAGGATDEQSTHVSVNLRLGKVTLGGAYVQSKSDVTLTNTAKNKSYHLGAAYALNGADTVSIGYTNVGDMTGAGTMTNRMAAGAGTGATLTQLRYERTLSKRTSIGAQYGRLKNDANATYALGADAARQGVAGSSNSAFGVFTRHRF